MHAISHTLAHRAPPASRTRARWQPYSSLPPYSAALSVSSSSSSKSSSPASNSTPATSVISPCQPTPAACDTSDRSALQNPAMSAAESLRDANASKNKFALGLVGELAVFALCAPYRFLCWNPDQAVKTLCEVWRPQDIPAVFNAPRPAKQTASLPNISPKSPIFEHTSFSRLATPKSHSTAAFTASTPSIPTPSAPALVQSGTTPDLRHLVPIRGFVHEVLRRSRTSGCVLQTALCYLEAIRPKIPELACLERIGKGNNGEPESAPRIMVATAEEIEQSKREEEEEMAFGEGPSTVRFDSNDIDAMDTVRIEADEGNYCYGPDDPSMNQQRSSSCASMQVDSARSHIGETDFSSTQPSTSTASLSPSADLPSPLLCPRRAFLAALILASKFTQDKCYSNRAWAKLSGLPPREIGRCERALGSALEWRLWVGKTSCAAATSSPQPPAASRAVMRCQSESSLNMTISSPSETINPPPTMIGESSAFVPETVVVASGGLMVPAHGSTNRRIIKRASTLPDGALSRHFNRSSRAVMPQASSPPVPVFPRGWILMWCRRSSSYRLTLTLVPNLGNLPAARWSLRRRHSSLPSNCKLPAPSRRALARHRLPAPRPAQICRA